MNLLEAMLAIRVAAVNVAAHQKRVAMRTTVSDPPWARDAVEAWLDKTRNDGANGGFTPGSVGAEGRNHSPPAARQ